MRPHIAIIWIGCLLLALVAGTDVLAQTRVSEVSDAQFNDGTFNGTEVEGTGVNATIQLASNDWFDVAWTNRRPINITNNSAGALPQDYVVTFTLNHAALVAANASRSNGTDLRVVYFDGTTNQELAFFNSTAFDQAATTIAFALQAQIAGSGSSTDEYFLYYGNPSNTAAPIQPAAVFELYDTFDRPLDDLWTAPTGAWSISGEDVIYTGAGDELLSSDAATFQDFSVTFKEQVIGGGGFTNTMDTGFYFRATDVDNGYFFRVSGADADLWTIARIDNGVTTLLTSGNVTTPTNEYEVTVEVIGNQFTFYLNGGQLGTVNDATYTTGRVGFFAGEGRYGHDDVQLRPLIDADPTATLDPEEDRTDFEPTGTYLSNVIDSGTAGNVYSSLVWHEDLPTDTGIQVEARASDTVFAAGDTAPAWSVVANQGDPAVTGQYIQYRLTLTTTSETDTPALLDIGFNAETDVQDESDSRSDGCYLAAADSSGWIWLLVLGAGLLLLLRRI